MDGALALTRSSSWGFLLLLLLFPRPALAGPEEITADLDRAAVPAIIEAIDDAQSSVDAVVYKFSEETLLAAVR